MFLLAGSFFCAQSHISDKAKDLNTSYFYAFKFQQHLKCTRVPVYKGDDSEGILSSIYDMPTVINVDPLTPLKK